MLYTFKGPNVLHEVYNVDRNGEARVVNGLMTTNVYPFRHVKDFYMDAV